MQRFAPRIFAQLFGIMLLLVPVSYSQAQVLVHADVPARSRALSNIRRTPAVDRSRRDKLVRQLALRDDYRRLQVVNNDLMKGVFKPADDNQTITQKEIRSKLGEIKKLAERLRLNFGLPEVEADEPAADLALKPGLLQLDKTIMSFVDNPLLRDLRVYDAELAAQAARDLEAVSRLAEALRQLANEK